MKFTGTSSQVCKYYVSLTAHDAPNVFNHKYRLKTKARNKSRGEIFLQNKVKFIFCWIIWSAEGTTPQKYNSLYGALLQIMQLDMNYGAPSPFTEVHE